MLLQNLSREAYAVISNWYRYVDVQLGTIFIIHKYSNSFSSARATSKVCTLTNEFQSLHLHCHHSPSGSECSTHALLYNAQAKLTILHYSGSLTHACYDCRILELTCLWGCRCWLLWHLVDVGDLAIYESVGWAFLTDLEALDVRPWLP